MNQALATVVTASDLPVLLRAPSGSEALESVEVAALDEADLKRGRLSILRAMADVGHKVTGNALALYHKTVHDMVLIAAYNRMLQRVYKMRPSEIVTELNTLGCLSIGYKLAFTHNKREYRLTSYDLTDKKGVASLREIDNAFAPLIYPAEIRENGRVMVDAPCDPAFADAVAQALLDSGVNLDLNRDGLAARVGSAMYNKALKPGYADSVVTQLAKATRILSTGKMVAKVDGKYAVVDAKPEQITAARGKRDDAAAKLTDILLLSDDAQRAAAAKKAGDAAKKAADAKLDRETGAAFREVLAEFEITSADQLRAALTAAANAGYEYVAPAPSEAVTVSN